MELFSGIRYYFHMNKCDWHIPIGTELYGIVSILSMVLLLLIGFANHLNNCPTVDVSFDKTLDVQYSETLKKWLRAQFSLSN